jgi:hypothetical protein
MSEKPKRPPPIFAAIEFVAAQPGGPDRILRRHRAARNGTCTGCTVAATTYPCQAARIAQIAQRRTRQQPRNENHNDD